MLNALPRPKASHLYGYKPCRFISHQNGTATEQFLIQVPDFPETQEIRARTKQTHIQECTSLIESGKLSYFGVTMSSHAPIGETAKINGSVMVLEAENEEYVKEFLERDAYTRAGVWNIDGAQIWPFKSG